MTDRPVHLTTGLPETVLDLEPADVRTALASALTADPPQRRAAVAAVVAKWPRSLDAWSALGDLARDTIEGYAAYRVGYHRGLDRLRASGWRGSGYVRWRHEGNRGFLTAVDGLRRCAAEIGEIDEQERCELFLHQLDPEWDRRANVG
jgi:hypothetical protein